MSFLVLSGVWLLRLPEDKNGLVASAAFPLTVGYVHIVLT